MRMSTVLALGLAGALASSIVGPTASAGSMPERLTAKLVPKTDHEPLRAGIYAAFPRPEGRWGAVHVVDRACSVSRAVTAHLVARRASAQVDELVIVIDPEGATKRDDMELVHAGFRVRIVAEDRARGIVQIATPMMIVARPDGTLAYVGGHRAISPAERIRSLGPRDGSVAPRSSDGYIDAIITTELATSGTTDVTAPVIGCAGSDFARTTL